MHLIAYAAQLLVLLAATTFVERYIWSHDDGISRETS
jgi:hypothetical protein